MTPTAFALSCAIERTVWAVILIGVPAWYAIRALLDCFWPPQDDPHRPAEIAREHWGVKRP